MYGFSIKYHDSQARRQKKLSLCYHEGRDCWNVHQECERSHMGNKTRTYEVRMNTDLTRKTES